MGKKSIKTNKSVYQLKREELRYSREEACEHFSTISPERLERLENERIVLQPRDVLEISQGYAAPELVTYYCQNDCPLGVLNKRKIELKPLSQIAVEMINAINNADKIKMKMLEIVADGIIAPDEYGEFSDIEEVLEEVASSVDSLKLWISKQKANGEMIEY